MKILVYSKQITNTSSFELKIIWKELFLEENAKSYTHTQITKIPQKRMELERFA